MARLNPYLSFRTEARDALEYYRSALGGEVQIDTYGSIPGMVDDPEEQHLVMHGQLETPHGLCLMAADTPSVMEYVAPNRGVTVALTGGAEDHEYVATAYERLASDATVSVPFEKAPWGDYFGQLTDKYGVSWMFDVGDPGAE
ncbi:VOC family protein [Isoptericola variabilis]|uniref:Glyoxalase/bleomycin resistance protein/dioxygenase n=1 Tax=Isoptericola variabilis (strain 225) TaxID=743718 RepID=F6FTZ7_ISOV2|nr:VOC family protein [Isoptericola variabilis]AEG45368.1 Glyoxalase/bleomycin resistance protein/dioxygenase [Isoptericola variabilis 225]TWH34871.1 PhnB protein [Isoptericola variabilis J7]